jgi:glycopeptide antibiotics resistance protein
MTGDGTVPVSVSAAGAALGCAIVAGTALWLRRRRGTDASRRAAARTLLDLGIGLWLALTLVVTLTPDPVSYARRIVILTPTGFGKVLTDPHGHRRILAELALNCLLFVPFGILGRARWRALRRPIPLILVAAAISVGIEGMQFALAVGRTTSTDDVLANTFGALLGWAAAGIVGAAWRRRSRS